MNILDYIEKMKDMYEGTGSVIQGPRNTYQDGLLVGKPTKEVTQFDRRIYETPEGELVSEKSATLFLNGKWINVPSIHGGKKFNEDQLRSMLKEGFIEPTSIHQSRSEAETAAMQRSDMMKHRTKGFADGQLVTPNVDGSRPGYAAPIKQGVQPGPGRAGKDAYDVVLSKRGQKIIKAVKEYNNLVLKDFNKGNLVNTKSFAQFAGKKYGHQLVKAQSDIAYIYPDVKEFKIQKLDIARDKLFRKLINEANQGEQFVDFPSIAKKISKTAPIVHTSAAYRKLLDTKSDKVKKVFNNMIKNDEPLHLVGKGHKHLWDANPLLKIIGQRADVKSAALMREALDTDPFYKKNKKLIKFAGDARLMDYGKPLSEILEQADYRIGGGVQWSYGTGKRPAKDVADTINDFALKHWNYHKRNQTGESQIEFFSKKNNKPINWEKVSKSPRTGVKSLVSTDVYFKYKNDPKQSKWSVVELRKSGRDAGIFDEVYKTRYSYNNMMNKMVTNPVNPTGKKIKFGQLMSKVFKEGFDDASSPYAIDHIKGVANSPFNDLRLASTRTNFALSYINKHIPQKNFKKTLISELMGGVTDFKSEQYINDLVKHGEGLAKEVLVGGKKVPISVVQEVGAKFLKPSKFRELTGPQQEHIKRMSKADTYAKFKQALTSSFQDLSPQSVLQMGRTHGCLKKQEGGSIMRCLQTKFNEAPEKFLQRSAPLAKNNMNLFNWFKNGRKIARGTGVFAAWEAAFAPLVAGWMATEGESGARMLNEIAYGVPFIGETEKAEWMRYAGGDEKAYAMKRMGEMEDQEIPYLYQQLEDTRKQNAPTRAKMPNYVSPKEQYILDDIKEKEQEYQGYINTPEFWEGPTGKYLNEPVAMDAFNLADATTAKIAADKAARKKATFDKLREHKIYADPNWQEGRISRMGGGMVGIRKPHAIPPERQGLRSIMINVNDD